MSVNREGKHRLWTQDLDVGRRCIIAKDDSVDDGSLPESGLCASSLGDDGFCSVPAVFDTKGGASGVV